MPRLAAFYELGSRVLARAQSHPKGGASAAARHIADTEGVSFDAAVKAATLVAQHPRGLPTWLKALEGSISVNHVRRVLKLKNATRRRYWLERAAATGMPSSTMDREIRRVDCEAPRPGGPSFMKPTNLPAAVDHLAGWIRDWRARFAAVWSQADVWVDDDLADTPPEEVADRIQAARRALRQLGVEAATLEANLHKLEGKLRKDARKQA